MNSFLSRRDLQECLLLRYNAGAITLNGHQHTHKAELFSFQKRKRREKDDSDATNLSSFDFKVTLSRLFMISSL